MHYVCHNIVKPLTRKAQLSYAEVAGPHEVEYFVSHYWGTPFRDYVSSMWKHAEIKARGLEWYITKYWICTFANNQWHVDKELGDGCGWQNSSFYLALQCRSTKGTAMILDEQAMPLQRSWCLFELFQTFRLNAKDPTFEFLGERL